MPEDPIRDPHGIRRGAGESWREVMRLEQLERYLVDQLAKTRAEKKAAADAAIDGMAAAGAIDRAELRERAKS